MRLAKKLVALGIVWGLSLISCFTVKAGQWQKNDTGWWYTFDDGAVQLCQCFGSSYNVHMKSFL